jgi:hypothetical protein
LDHLQLVTHRQYRAECGANANSCLVATPLSPLKLATRVPLPATNELAESAVSSHMVRGSWALSPAAYSARPSMVTQLPKSNTIASSPPPAAFQPWQTGGTSQAASESLNSDVRIPSALRCGTCPCVCVCVGVGVGVVCGCGVWVCEFAGVGWGGVVDAMSKFIQCHVSQCSMIMCMLVLMIC